MLNRFQTLLSISVYATIRWKQASQVRPVLDSVILFRGLSTRGLGVTQARLRGAL
jgi:hypothetical protein